MQFCFPFASKSFVPLDIAYTDSGEPALNAHVLILPARPISGAQNTFGAWYHQDLQISDTSHLFAPHFPVSRSIRTKMQVHTQDMFELTPIYLDLPKTWTCARS
jgi:hypothetical protein